LELTMEVPEETNYFENGDYTFVADGQEVPLWSFNEETGSWDFESESLITTNDDNKLEVTGELTHLSWWNFDWYWNETWCPEGLKINFISDDYSCDCYLVEADVRNPNTGTFMWRSWFYVCQDVPLVFWNAPANLPVDIEYKGYCNSLVTTQEDYYYENLCAPDILDVYWESFVPGETFTFELVARCPNEPLIEIRPSFGVWYRDSNTWCWRWASMTDGLAEICDIIVGQEYIMGVYYDNSWHEFSVTPQFDSYVYEDVMLSQTVCSDVFGY
jgi:hypothetical protein